MSIDLVPLWVAEWTESDKHIKLIGLMTITMKKNNSDQTKGKPWTESVTIAPTFGSRVSAFATSVFITLFSGNLERGHLQL